METILDLEENKAVEFNYASFLIRLVALFIDGIIFFIFAVIMLFIFGLNISFSPENINKLTSENTGVLLGLCILLFSYCYIVIFEISSTQGTLGKMAVGIKVVDLNGEKISIASSIIRTTIKYISSIVDLIPGLTAVSPVLSFFLLINYLFPMWDKKNQALHDKLAKTYVIRK